MPQFMWRGINLAGTPCSGTIFARTPDDVAQVLFAQHIALTWCKKKRSWIFSRSVKSDEKVMFFQHLAILIEAGILLPQALVLVASQLHSSHLQEMVGEISLQVHQGISLGHALSAYPRIFDALEIKLIKAGEESGSLAQALTRICMYLDANQQFRQKIRSALMLPLFTFLFFIMISTVIFIWVLPRFADLFTAMHKDLPPLTQHLINASNAIKRGPSTPITLGLCFILILMLIGWRNARVRAILVRFLLRVPLIGRCMKLQFVSSFFQSLSLLIAGGVPVVSALHIIGESVQNNPFAVTTHVIAQDVIAGSALTGALAAHPWLFSQDIIAMVHVGQESGRLSTLCGHIAHTTQLQLARLLQRMTTLIQPALMIILGLCVALLIVAVYGPLCNIADIM